MERPMHRRADGQGTVEYLGVVLVVALLVMSASVAIGRLRPEPRPIDPAVSRVVERVALATLSVGESRPRSRWRRIAATFGKGVRVVVVGQIAFSRGFQDAALDDLRALVTDPAGMLTGGGTFTSILRDPVGTARQEVAAATAYLRALRRMPAAEAYVRVMADSGRLAEDVLVARGRRALVDRAAGRGRARGRGDDLGASRGEVVRGP